MQKNLLSNVTCPNCASWLEERVNDSQRENVFCVKCEFACRYVRLDQQPQSASLSISAEELRALAQGTKVLPPLIVHHAWKIQGVAMEQCILYPFISVQFLKERQTRAITLSATGNDPVLFSLDSLAKIVLHESPSDEEIIATVKDWKKVETSEIQRCFRIGYSRAAHIKERVIEIRDYSSQSRKENDSQE